MFQIIAIFDINVSQGRVAKFVRCGGIFNERFITIFTARRYVSAVLAVVVCPCVCLCVRLSVRLSQAGIVSKRLQIGSRKQRRTIAQGV